MHMHGRPGYGSGLAPALSVVPAWQLHIAATQAAARMERNLTPSLRGLSGVPSGFWGFWGH